MLAIDLEVFLFFQKFKEKIVHCNAAPIIPQLLHLTEILCGPAVRS